MSEKCNRELGDFYFSVLLKWQTWDDHVPSADGFASVKMHTHLFRYFNGLPGAAALRARLNGVRTIAEIEATSHLRPIMV